MLIGSKNQDSPTTPRCPKAVVGDAPRFLLAFMWHRGLSHPAFPNLTTIVWSNETVLPSQEEPN